MLNEILISDSHAQDAAAPAKADFSFSSFVPLILIFAIFYFLIVRPQTKKMKEHANLVNNLKTGNKVVTSGGIVGVVTDVFPKENQVEVEIANGVRVKLLKNYVSDLVKEEVKK
jgi:preprotein translocase subunit YajC